MGEEPNQWWVRAQYACGCQIREKTIHTKGGQIESVFLGYCPKHKSAPDMYEALKAVDDYLSAPYPENMKLKQIAADKLVSALNKAEGG